jgi:hypothetical protein
VMDAPGRLGKILVGMNRALGESEYGGDTGHTIAGSDRAAITDGAQFR